MCVWCVSYSSTFEALSALFVCIQMTLLLEGEMGVGVCVYSAIICL